MLQHQSANGRLYTLDAMRGLAAIVVLAWHFPDLHHFVSNGYLAVDFFFALSGLVVAKAYEVKLATDLSALAFMKQRFIRLYPMYALGFGLGLAVTFAKIIADHLPASEAAALARSIPFNLFMLPAFGSADLFPANSPSWSLFFEMVINIAFCLWLTRRTMRTLAIVALASGAILAASGLWSGHLDIGWNWATFPAGFARVTYSFTIGMMIWRSGLAARPSRHWFSLLVILALIAVLVVPIPAAYKAVTSIVLSIFILPALVVLGARWQPPRGSEAAAEALGDLSYPLYAVHKPLIATTPIVRALGLPTPVWVTSFLLGVLLATWILGRFIDPLLRKFLGGLVAFQSGDPDPTKVMR